MKRNLQGVMVHVFNPSVWETGSLWVWAQPSLDRAFQARWSYLVRSCLPGRSLGWSLARKGFAVCFLIEHVPKVAVLGFHQLRELCIVNRPTEQLSKALVLQGNCTQT